MRPLLSYRSVVVAVLTMVGLLPNPVTAGGGGGIRKVLDEIRAMLLSESDDEVDSGLASLALLGEQGSPLLPDVLRIAVSENAELANHAVNVIHSLDSPCEESEEALLEILTAGPSDTGRASAARELGHQSSAKKGVVAALEKALSAEESCVRFAAAGSLLSLGHAMVESSRLLLAAIYGPDLREQTRAISALRDAAVVRREVCCLLLAASLAKNPDARVAGLFGFAEVAQQTEELTWIVKEAADASDARVRLAAATAQGMTMGDGDFSFDLFEEGLQSAESGVQVAAVCGLSLLGRKHRKARELLVAFFKREWQNGWDGLAYYLADMGVIPDEILGVFCRDLVSASSGYRVRALRALESAGRLSLVPGKLKDRLLGDEDPAVRFWARELLSSGR